MELNLQKGTILFICDPLTDVYATLFHNILFNPLSYTLFEYFNGVYTELQPSDRACAFRKSSCDFFERPASTLNVAAIQSRNEAYIRSPDKKSRVFSS